MKGIYCVHVCVCKYTYYLDYINKDMLKEDISVFKPSLLFII